jgi:dCMP deaminase
MNENELRWDKWFYNMCVEVSKNSKCLSRQIGSVLVRDKSVVSTGYNGPPRGIIPCDQRWKVDKKMREAAWNDELDDRNFEIKYNNELKGVCPRYIKEFGFKSGEGLEWCVAGHSEENALLNAARLGIATKGCKLYMNCQIPCKNCLIKIINCGIEEIIVTGFDFYDVSSEYLLKQSKLKYRKFSNLIGEGNI